MGLLLINWGFPYLCCSLPKAKQAPSGGVGVEKPGNRRRPVRDPGSREAAQFLLAASRVALQKLEAHFPDAPETVLLLFAIQKMRGMKIAEG